MFTLLHSKEILTVKTTEAMAVAEFQLSLLVTALMITTAGISVISGQNAGEWFISESEPRPIQPALVWRALARPTSLEKSSSPD